MVQWQMHCSGSVSSSYSDKSRSEIMFPIVNLGPLAIQVPGLIILLGIWLGLSLAERYSTRRGVEASILYNLVFITLICGVIGARLSYLVRYPEFFLENPASIVSLNPNLLDPVGGIAVGFIATIIYANRKQLPLWATLDALTPFLAVASVAVGISHLSSGAGYGLESEVAWSIELWGARRHPTQIYETIAALLILLIFWPGWQFWNRLSRGTYWLAFVGTSAAARIFIEAFRADSQLLPGGFRLPQLAAWLILALCLCGIYLLNKPKEPLPPQ